MSKVFRGHTIGSSVAMVCLKILDKAKTAKFEARFPGLQRPIEGAICTRCGTGT